MKRPNVVFFGGEPLGVPALDALYNEGVIPNVVITNPDRPQGRRMVLTPPPTKVRAIGYGIPVFQPDSYNASTTREWFETTSWDLFVVVAYNFILPKWLLELPKYGTLNVHPSLLPKLRGASPIRSAILQ
ncbi:MAG: methionyl-tRNA formyltransferase, partial [Cyanobacteria bacterium HKST-UBA02]|nr:methionyl-tRNA formyltransferase [Cyanobacteria bacterium HKST-UBA02]